MRIQVVLLGLILLLMGGFVAVATGASTPGSSTATTTSMSPQLVVTPTFSPSNPQTGQPVNFAVTVTGGSGNYLYSWFFGDGASTTAQNPAHVFATAGAFNSQVCATDQALGGISNCAVLQVTVTQAPGGQTGYYTVVFNVVDSYSGAGIPASITISSATGPTQTVTTNNYGQATVQNLPQGTYSVTFSAVNYAPQTNTYTISQSQSITATLLLQKGFGYSGFNLGFANAFAVLATSLIAAGAVLMVMGAAMPRGKARA